MRAMRLVRSEKHDIFTVIIAANSNSIYPQQIRVKVDRHMHQECLSSHPGTVNT